MDQADNLIRRWLDNGHRTNKTAPALCGDLSKSLAGKKAATFFQLDRRISTMIDGAAHIAASSGPSQD